jgi:putative pyruvate formate lyase activating enzyme
MDSKPLTLTPDRWLKRCILCGHHCGINRFEQLGVCQAGPVPRVAAYLVHRGEEPMISGRHGSGAIFFSHCSLDCVYCQNYEISQLARGDEKTEEELIGIMRDLQAKKVHNLNLVSPTHYAPQIFSALEKARSQGLNLPVVYNSGGYDSLELLRELEGKVEIYLPDFKYSDNQSAWQYSGAPNYVETAQQAIVEMFRQRGNIVLDNNGVAISGLLVRHLVLPGRLAEGKKIMQFLAEISPDIWVSIMAQYSPQFKAPEHKELARRLLPEEYQSVVDCAEDLGLHNIYTQAIESSEVYLPDFKSEEPFDQ